MEVLTTILYIIFAFTSVVLVLIVLIQDEGGEGFGGIFGGGSTTPFGSRSGNVLTRFTSILAALFILICVVLGLINKSAEIEATPDFEAEAENADPLIQTDDYTVEDSGVYTPEGLEVEGQGGGEASSEGSLGPLSPDLLIEDIIRSEQDEVE